MKRTSPVTITRIDPDLKIPSIPYKLQDTKTYFTVNGYTMFRNNINWLTFIVVVFFQQDCFSQEKHKGSLVLFFKDTVKGEIQVDLHRPNEEMIGFVSTSKTKSKGKNGKTKMEFTETARLNTATITALLIAGNRYCFRDLKDVYAEDSIKRNCCVQRIAGTDTLGLFEFVNSNNVSSFYIQTFNDGRQLYNIDHPYLLDGFMGFAAMRFTTRRPALAEKIIDQQAGYVYENGQSTVQRLTVWKKIIAEYYNGKKLP